MSATTHQYREGIVDLDEGGFRLRDCPICLADLTTIEHTHRHFLEEHTPADFGLTPLDEGDHHA